MGKEKNDMRIGLPVFRERLSPLFDASCHIRVFDLVEGEALQERQELAIQGDSSHERIGLLRAHGVTTLICAAVSRECQALLQAQGIDVLAGFSGPAEEILQAFLHHRLHEKRFRLPGWKGAGCRRKADVRAACRKSASAKGTARDK